MRVSSDTARQTTDRQGDALLDAGVDPHQLFADQASGTHDARPGLAAYTLSSRGYGATSRAARPAPGAGIWHSSSTPG